MSKTISTPMIEQGAEEFEQLKGETTIEAMQEKYMNGEKASWWEIKKKFEMFKDKAGEFMAWCRERIVTLVDRGARYCAGMIFDCLIFPGATFFAVYFMLKRGLSSPR